MSDEQLKRRLETLRSLRQNARKLHASFCSDQKNFEHAKNPLCYYRLPSKPPNATVRVSVTPTCTAWMAFCASRQKVDPEHIAEAYSKLLDEPWDTGGLPLNNPFTVAVLSRSVGFLVEHGVLDKETVRDTKRSRSGEKKHSEFSNKLWVQCDGKSLFDIVQEFLKDPVKTIAIDPFPASPTIAYWLVDAATKLKLDIDNSFGKLATWAATEFRRQHSLVSAAHQSMMDPVALVMSACVCRCLRRSSETSKACNDILRDCLFPSDIELAAGVRAFFSCQNDKTGVWEKYFPIFHYPESGPNHCWHFEILEAVIGEFHELLVDDDILNRLDLALRWLQENRLHFQHDGRAFYGWNGGGDIKAMRRREPESWPTSVAHMFLARLIDHLSFRIHETVLDKFGDRVQVHPEDRDISHDFPHGKRWTEYMDARFGKATECGLDVSRDSVKKLIEEEVLSKIDDAVTVSPHLELNESHSAVLFGPPGTAKTSLCKAIAQRLGWHFVELSPSDFLSGGLEGIYNKVTEVFEDLLDLFGVVVLFDEMDALVQNREGDDNKGKLDVTETLLTTSMLPKLTKLHDNRRVMYFMATNYIGAFDGAIIRAGRFDLLVHMGPPSTASKIDGLAAWCEKDDNGDIAEAKTHLNNVLDDKDDLERFERFTYGETQRFFFTLKVEAKCVSVARAIINTEKDSFVKHLRAWTKSKITLSDESDVLQEFRKDEMRVCVQ